MITAKLLCLWLALCFSYLLLDQAHADVFDHAQTAAQLLQGALSQPSGALSNAQVMRGHFVYRKYLKEIPQPITSRGSFVFAKGLGVDWHTLQPFDSDFVLTASGMKQIDDGKITMQMNASEQPAVGIVAHIFLSLLSLDVESLQNSFALFGIQHDRQWQIGLRPTVPAIASVFQDAVVSGAAQAEILVLHDANGDRTEINFSEVQYSPYINAADRQPFLKSQ